MTIHTTRPTTHPMITITTLDDESLLLVCSSLETPGDVISVVETMVLVVAAVVT